LVACLAWHDKQAPDEDFIRFLPIIKHGATDERNFVKKAVNWALRNIGKRNATFNKAAIKTAQELQRMDSKWRSGLPRMPSENWKALESKSVYGSRIMLGQAAGKSKAACSIGTRNRSESDAAYWRSEIHSITRSREVRHGTSGT
jgi:DNA alkylation repair enzyme